MQQPRSNEPDASTEPEDSSVTREAGGAFLAQIAGLLLRYGSSVVLTRMLGASWFGSLTLGLTIALLLGTLSALGLSPGLLPFLARARLAGQAELRAVVRAGAWIGIVSAILAGGLLWVAAPWLARWGFRNADLDPILRPLSLFVAFSALSTIGATLVQGLVGVRPSLWISWVAGPLATLVGYVVAWTVGLGLGGVLGAIVLGQAFALGLSVYLVQRTVPGFLRPAPGALRLPLAEVLDRCWPLLGSSLFGFLLLWMDVLLMGIFRSSEEVGLYAACTRLAPVIALVNLSVGPVFLTRMSRLYVDRDWAAADRLYKLTGSWSLWSGVLMASVLFVWGPNVLGLFGPEFVVGAPVLAVLATGRLVSAVTGMCGRMLAVTERTRLHMLNNLLMVGLNGVLDLLLIPRHGGAGAALATCASVILVNGLQTAQVWALYRMQPFTARSLGGFVGILALAAASFAWRDGPAVPWGWLLPLVTFLVASALLWWRLGAGEEERAYLRWLTR